MSFLKSLASPLISAGATLLGANMQNRATSSQSDQNTAMQKEFAQKGIRWKVEDAKSAGIHPLYAMGAQTTSFQPNRVGGSSVATSMRNVGQDIGRAVNAATNKSERNMAELNLQSAKAVLDGQQIENQIKLAQLNQLKQVGPALPSANDSTVIKGQGDAHIIDKQRTTATAKTTPSQFARAHASTTFLRTDVGGLRPVQANPQGGVKEEADITDLNTLEWWGRNRIMPFFSGITPPKTSDFPLPKGYTWKWSPYRQSFMPSKGGKIYKYNYRK